LMLYFVPEQKLLFRLKPQYQKQVFTQTQYNAE